MKESKEKYLFIQYNIIYSLEYKPVWIAQISVQLQRSNRICSTKGFQNNRMEHEQHNCLTIMHYYIVV